MNDSQQDDRSTRYAVVGEDTPRWLTFAFAIVGLLVAAAAIGLWLTRQPPASVATVPGTTVPESAGDTASATQALEPIVDEQPAAMMPTPPVTASAETPIAPETGGEEGGIASAPATESIPPVPTADSAEVPPTAAGTESAVAPEPAEIGELDEGEAQNTQPGEAAEIVRQEAVPREPCPEDITVKFRFDSASPGAGEDVDALRNLAGWLKQHPEVKVAVQGHADSIGTDPYNLVLSYQRAEAVAALLRDGGATPAQVLVGAAGSHEPINGLPARARENRRVVVQVMNFQDCEPISR